jgi:DUF1365 family protein
MRSCLYVGRVEHRRHAPVEHRFSFPLYMFYLDLDELDLVFGGRWLWSHRRPALGRLRREDHFGDPAVPLAEAVRCEVERQTGRRPEGPVRLLTHLRYGGFVLNPLSAFYCFAPEGERLEAVLAEVTSTPWNERHCYALSTPDAARHAGTYRVEAEKEMHVSPFMDMGLTYRFGIGAPGGRLALSIECLDPDAGRIFDATLTLSRREITTGSLLGTALRHPLMTAQVFAGIYWQALRLWWKGAPFHSHPGRSRAGLEGAQ